MTEQSQAWVWSQYQGVVLDKEAAASSEGPGQPLRVENVESFKPRLASEQSRLQEYAAPARAKYGYVIAGAVIAGLFFPMIAIVLLLVSALLIFSGREPKKAQEFFNSIPAGAYVGKALDSIDSFLK